MILYHGSNINIDIIDLSKSKRYKDFGQAFSLSSEREQAIKMAEAKVVQFGGEEAVTAFEFEERNMNKGELQTKIFEGYTREWQNLYFAIAMRANNSSITTTLSMVQSQMTI